MKVAVCPPVAESAAPWKTPRGQSLTNKTAMFPGMIEDNRFFLTATRFAMDCCIP